MLVESRDPAVLVWGEHENPDCEQPYRALPPRNPHHRHLINSAAAAPLSLTRPTGRLILPPLRSLELAAKLTENHLNEHVRLAGEPSGGGA